MVMVVHAADGRVVTSIPCRELTYETMRAIMHLAFPDREILSPLDSTVGKKDLQIFTIQLQRSLAEPGRVSDKFYEWATARKEV
jgi:hypothetical protein